MSGVLSAVDLETCVVNFVLPPGAILSSEGGGDAHLRIGRRAPPGTPDIEEEDSRNGLGGYHGSIHIMYPGMPITIYYSVAVWSEGNNGIAIPGWEPWENACATLYHELNEARTDPAQPALRGRLKSSPQDYLTERIIAPSSPLAARFGRPRQVLLWPGQILIGHP